MPTTKKIYRYVNRLVSVCRWCDGFGSRMGSYLFEKCNMCKGTGGKWEKVKELVGEEVTE